MKSTKKLPYIDYQESLIEDLKNNPEEAEVYLTIALDEYQKDKNITSLLFAFNSVSKAFNGIINLIKKSKMKKESLLKVVKGLELLYEYNLPKQTINKNKKFIAPIKSIKKSPKTFSENVYSTKIAKKR